MKIARYVEMKRKIFLHSSLQFVPLKAFKFPTLFLFVTQEKSHTHHPSDRQVKRTVNKLLAQRKAETTSFWLVEIVTNKVTQSTATMNKYVSLYCY